MMLLSIIAAISLIANEMFLRDEEPDGLSGITWVGGNEYLSVCDSDGKVYRLRINLDEETGAIKDVVIGESVQLEKAQDLEGCAWDVKKGTLWATDEKDHSIREFDIKTGRRLSQLRLPAEFVASIRRDRSLESLAMSKDGMTMWTANEEALKSDSPRATTSTGTVVRLCRYVRNGANEAWAASGQWAYRTDPLAEAANPTRQNCCGVSDLVVLSDGRLIVLERELSGFTFHFRLYLVDPTASQWPTIVEKKLLYNYTCRCSIFSSNSQLGNFEGICLGPKLKDGSSTLVLVSDSGDRMMTKPLVMTFKMKEEK